MQITFLGTGTSQGVPVIGCQCEVCTSADPRDARLRSSVMVETDTLRIIIDAGPDFRTQMLREGINHLDALLITHGHKDHIGGLDDVRPFNYLMRKPVEVYATANVHDDIRRDFFYAFEEDRYPGIPEFNLHLVDNNPFKIGSLEVIPVEVDHFHLKVLGFRIGGFAYITDASHIPDVEMDKLRGLEVLVINALRLEPHISHFSLPQALEIIAELRPRRAFLTHISHRLGTHARVAKTLPQGVWLAYDGLKIEVNLFT
ncbi:MAG: MBL fold metallo-hydrolase [Bacteroidales bacterium]